MGSKWNKTYHVLLCLFRLDESIDRKDCTSLIKPPYWKTDMCCVHDNDGSHCSLKHPIIKFEVCYAVIWVNLIFFRKKNGSLKQTDVVSRNAEIAESTDTGILEPAIPSTSSSIQLQPHLPTLPSSNFGQVVSRKRRKYDSSYLSFEFTSTGDEEAPTFCFATKYWQTAP
ncbi:uncharacterized protein TNIN_314921 [Trichonephila inaurata madagascariensis]|uniref:Uncharacterized protein n=1 Tax=Trichonephila inaurata madagascariensis TaxID=2747483 RepID=A0A8X6X1K6_9ARAC|nr:uncharacterized protein TNIN_314921 [Trichonephila inaurata madagascariensis]